ncbi:MAG TPA: copper amine oxidase N-terminal domain-containing protein [Symbiobacteriaceae bacterium]|nr:copper amine oxidase N-terminal domain-containing protein [Symbiobacteriaceae bacterium]
MQDGRLLVPMRALFEALGAEVRWEADTSTAVGIRGGTEIRIPVGSTSPTVYRVVKTVDVPAQIIAGRTFIPLRLAGEALGDLVGWDAASRTVTVTRARR